MKLFRLRQWNTDFQVIHKMSKRIKELSNILLFPICPTCTSEELMSNSSSAVLLNVMIISFSSLCIGRLYEINVILPWFVNISLLK